MKKFNVLTIKKSQLQRGYNGIRVYNIRHNFLKEKPSILFKWDIRAFKKIITNYMI